MVQGFSGLLLLDPPFRMRFRRLLVCQFFGRDRLIGSLAA